MSTALVLPSPLLGPLGYGPLAHALATHGWTARVADLPPAPFTPDEVLAAFAEQASDVDVLVPHSNAGLYAPAVARESGCRVTVFVDAALPPDRADHTRLAPAGFLTMLGDLADEDRRLPPWTRWWPEDDVRPLFPGGWFDRVDAAAPRLFLDYFTATIPVPRGWETEPSAYLGFGDTYAEEQAQARAYGWPLVVTAGHHLRVLTEPVEVAETVVAQADRLSRREGP